MVRNYCPHTIGEGQIIPSESASCTEGGLTEGKRCLVCGEILVAQEVISPLGHDFEYLTETDEDGTRINLMSCRRDGCEESKVVTDKERLIGEWRQASGINEGDIEITVKIYTAYTMLQYIPTLPIRVSNEDIYFYDDIYDEVKYISNPDIVFNNILFTTADKIINGERLLDTVEKIQNCEGCYVLTTNTKSQSVEKIMIYQMDGYYFF